jgi:hypothetical protein
MTKATSAELAGTNEWLSLIACSAANKFGTAKRLIGRHPCDAFVAVATIIGKETAKNQPELQVG